MKASLRSVRISPKKANLIAKMVRGLSVQDALHSLEHTQKRSARILEGLLNSAVANAQQNEKQDPENLVIKSLVVNKAQTYHRGVPMARGRVRPMRKFLSHITMTLGVAETPQKKEEKAPSQKPQKAVKKQQKSAPATKAAADDQDRGNGSSKESKKNTSPDPSVSAESTSSTSS